MATNGIRASFELRTKNKDLEKIEEKLNSFEERKQQLDERFENIADGDTEAMEQLLADADTLDTEKVEVENERSALIEEINELTQALNRSSRGKIVKLENFTEKNQDVEEIREHFNDYIRKRASGMITDDISVTIPEEVIYPPEKEVYTETDLEQYVNVINVTTSSGTYPVQKRQTAVMSTTEELDENPELAKPQFENVTWKVNTYRGMILISEEAIDDSAVDILDLVGTDILRQKINTTTKAIADLLKSYQAEELQTLDDIKTIINTKIDVTYDVSIFVTQSLYDLLDRLKDNDGRYLLQEDITAPSGKKLFGKPLIVVRDDILGNAVGDHCLFIGDMKAAITMFKRKDINGQWANNLQYGEYLQTGFRAGFSNVHSDAGYYCTFKEGTTEKSMLKGAVTISAS